MSKKPRIDHHAGTDKTITIENYSPSKKTRNAIIKRVTETLESDPNHLVEYESKQTVDE